MKLLVQPGDGISPLLRGIASAKESIEIVIFRLDRREIEQALAKAVNRGVCVRALIAHTNRSGEVALRRLEQRLLAAGATVARTADDLVRYHGKLMIVDRRELYLLAFNITAIDIKHSRSFGIITRTRDLVREAVKLFEADTERIPYEPGSPRFVVSPANARKELARLIEGAKKELLIYDLKLSDAAMIRILEERAKRGIEIRVIGRVTRKAAGVSVRKLHPLRLHTRTIVRDRNTAFIGSQSLRELEIDARREVGIIVREPGVIGRLIETFESDWAEAGKPDAAETLPQAEPAAKVAKKVAKTVTKDLPPVCAVLDGAVKEMLGGEKVPLNIPEIEHAVRKAVEEAVKEAIQDVVEDVVAEKDQSAG